MMNDSLSGIRAAGCFAQLGEVIRRVEFSNLNTREIVLAVRKIAEVATPEPAVRIALLGTHTFEPLPSYLSVRAAASQRTIDCWCGPYGQYMQPLSPVAPELRELRPDIMVLSAQMRSIAPRVVEDFGSLTPEEAEAERRRILNHVLDWAELATGETSASVLIANFPRPRYATFGIADAKREPSENAFYARLNLDLFDAVKSRSRLSVLDLDSVVSGHGAEISWTRRTFYLSRQPWQAGLCQAIAREIWRHTIAIMGWARKCLVLDLDNTLWGGVIGEDGPAGIRVGPGDPEGEAFADFQRSIRSLKARGVILAIASKNNPEDVAAAFEQRSDMPLKLDDFTIRHVGWGSKAQALESIASSLEIGLDSIVFLDDNPAERLLVRCELPSVVTPEMPEDPALYSSFLKKQAWFERSGVTVEDQGKARQYKEQAQRTVRRRSARNIDQYLEELQTVVEVRRAVQSDVPRLHQLFTKTNQFNLTTRRYGVGEIEGMVRSSRHVLCLASAQDRYGDLGQIGLFVLEFCGDDCRIDSFLMSCRALGRGIETVLMNALKREATRSGRRGMLRGQFIGTGRNAPARNFYASQGFEAELLVDREVVEYCVPIMELNEIATPHIRTQLPDKDSVQ